MSLILKNRGNYKALLTFKKATVIYDLTYYFCSKYLKKGDRTIDQMVQAARSGKQNIAEGVAASSTNAETEIRLVNVGKASFKELLSDFEDYLRTRRLRQWEENGKEVTWLRNFAKENPDSPPYLSIAERRTDEVVANMAIVLLKQEDYLLFKQLEALQKQYVEDGDFHARVMPLAKEAKIKARDAAMKKAKEWRKPCPKCGQPMSDGTTSENGKLIPKWRCFDCKLDVPAGPMEIWEAQRAANKRIWKVKEIYGY